MAPSEACRLALLDTRPAPSGSCAAAAAEDASCKRGVPLEQDCAEYAKGVGSYICSLTAAGGDNFCSRKLTRVAPQPCYNWQRLGLGHCRRVRSTWWLWNGGRQSTPAVCRHGCGCSCSAQVCAKLTRQRCDAGQGCMMGCAQFASLTRHWHQVLAVCAPRWPKMADCSFPTPHRSASGAGLS